MESRSDLFQRSDERPHAVLSRTTAVCAQPARSATAADVDLGRVDTSLHDRTAVRHRTGILEHAGRIPGRGGAAGGRPFCARVPSTGAPRNGRSVVATGAPSMGATGRTHGSSIAVPSPGRLGGRTTPSVCAPANGAARRAFSFFSTGRIPTTGPGGTAAAATTRSTPSRCVATESRARWLHRFPAPSRSAVGATSAWNWREPGSDVTWTINSCTTCVIWSPGRSTAWRVGTKPGGR